jgi:Flp pilus assembly protein TadG
MAALILIGLTIGAIALDFAHMQSVRSELQNATDAAAIAGAWDLNNDPDNAESKALSIASSNQADARDVSNESPNTEVTVQTKESGGPTDPGTCEVEAQMQIRHMLAPIFGRQVDTLTARSIAANHPVVMTLAKNQAFPIAVSIDQWPNGPSGKDKRLTQLKIGDDVTIIIRPNGVPGRNAVWTSFNYGSANTNTYIGMMEKVLNMEQSTKESYEVPAIEVGKTEIHLDNGLNSGAGLEKEFDPPIKARDFVIFPLIKGDNYNQTQPVIGFITVKVKQIKKTSGDYEVNGTLVKGNVKGIPGVSDTGDSDIDNSVNQLSAAVVKLITGNETF